MKKLLKNLRKKSADKKLEKNQWKKAAALDRVQAEEALKIIDQESDK